MTQPTSQMITSVTPVGYTRASVSGGDALRERQRQILASDRQITSYQQQAIAQRAQNEALERAKREQEAFLQQQQQYSQNMQNQYSNSFNLGSGQQNGNFSTSGSGENRPSGANLGNSIGAQAVKMAEQYLGMPYQWGGSSPKTSFDCSGLIQYVYGKLGINLPRVSNQQAMAGTRTSIGNLRPGDIVAWDRFDRNGKGYGGADHVAIYAGNGWIIEAAKKGTNIRYRKLGSADASAWGVRINY